MAAINGTEEDMKTEKCKETAVYMWGYLPGVSPEKSPLLSPVPVPIHGVDKWKDVCSGGCGFAMAISGSGKLITWGSTEEEGQSYATSGKHGEIPEPFSLPNEASVVKAAAGWAHCISVTERGEVYTWGWKECVPSLKIIRDSAVAGSFQKDNIGKQTEQVSPRSQGSSIAGEIVSESDNRKAGVEIIKKIKVSAAKEEFESSSSGDEFFAVIPSTVTLGPSVRITNVAAGGRHTLALSGKSTDSWVTALCTLKFQVWGWGYGGEGQLGLGSRIKMVSSPHLIPCIVDRTLIVHQGRINSSTQASKFPGSCVKEIACGGRHSAVLTDAGALLTFGWGLYGQCGQGSTNDQLRPTCVPALSRVQLERIALGLWHTVCITADGRVYAFGGNQFGQLGTGAEQAETQPRQLDAPSLERKRAKMVSCGARHSVILTEDLQVYSWGWNKYGQLGLGDSIDRNIPSHVTIQGCQPKNIACGWWHTLLLAETHL